MDIDYLLALQTLRDDVLGGTFNDVATIISDFIVQPWMFMFFCVVMWSISKKDGFFFFLVYGIGDTLNAMIKLTACVYRPWIRDARVLPGGQSKKFATGYSTPSGHCDTAVASYGALAKWQWPKRKWVTVVCVILILITMFSRNFLGVHYPQDVLIGAGACAIVFFLCTKFAKWLENCDSKRELIVLTVTVVLVCLMSAYIEFKPYPYDYVDGELLVDPMKMAEDGYAAIGMFAGLFIGWFIDHRWLQFEIFKNKKIGIPVAIVGAAPIYFWRNGIKAVLTPFVGPWWASFILRFGEFMYALVLFPLIIKLINYKCK